MTKEEQLGVPPTEVMLQLLEENRELVRLLFPAGRNRAEPEPCAETDSANALISAYHDVLALLEILSATSAQRTGEEGSGR